jgi:hypothetical protein
LSYTIKPGKDKCPIEVLSKAEVSPNPINEHPFGCPVYILDQKVQGGMKGEKWGDRSRPAIYLGNSTQYSRSVALALSLTTGLVSPQFHAKFNDEFDTVTQPQRDELPQLLWQEKCHFTSEVDISHKDHHIPVVRIANPTPAEVLGSDTSAQENDVPTEVNNQPPQETDVQEMTVRPEEPANIPEAPTPTLTSIDQSGC